ncbi:hypothetical protein MMC21_000642 [Puttea exsequens]|nr:hypothetical protein [Puttea exsequens]
MIDHMIGSLQNQAGSEALAYHYCDFANLPTLDPSKFVDSLVRQLALQMYNISPTIENLYHKCSGQPPQLNMLFEVLDHIVKQTFETVYFIVDGLDESPNRRLLLNGMQQLCKASGKTSSPKVLLSSRQEYDIRQALSTTPAFFN